MSDAPSSAPEPESSSEPRPRASRLKKIAIIAGGITVACLAAYVTGRMQTSGRIDDAEQAAGELRTEKDRLREQLDARQRDVFALEARRRLHLALLALDNRNFGIAQKQLRTGAKLLQQGPDTKALREIAEAMRTYDLTAVEDFGEHREHIVGWAARFDQAVPPRQL